MRNYLIQNFAKGLITSLEPRSIPDGAASNQHDWLTKGDKIELRRGGQVVGTTIAGSGRVKGIFTAHRADGTEILFRARGAKIEYYSTATADWVEVGTDILTTAAANDDISFAQYDSPAGAQLWISSAHSSLFKIMIANPGSYTDMADPTKNFKGHIKIKYNRMFLWGTALDKTGLYGSYIDSSINYTTITAEKIGSGDGITKTWISNVGPISAEQLGATGWTSTGWTGSYPTFTHTTGNTTALSNTLAAVIGKTYKVSYTITGRTAGTVTLSFGGVSSAAVSASGEYKVTATAVTGLSIAPTTDFNGSMVISIKLYTYPLGFKLISAKYTCMGVSVTDGTETFVDNFNGVLTGNLGGTGTINYTTGEYSVTFNTAPVTGAGNITATYQWEDSTNHGVADFSKSNPRTKGQGFILRQDDAGGNLQNVMTYGSDDYCMHEFKTWKLTIGLDDTTATNNVYREKVGIPNWRAAADTGNGIYYIDESDSLSPHFRLLTLDSNSGQVIPAEISSALDLTGYSFDQGVVYEYGDYILFAGRTLASTYNDTLFIYSKIWKAFDLCRLYVGCLATYGGTLHGGDSITNNVFDMFTGWVDDDSNIDNSWETGLTRLKIGELKKVKELIIDGYISNGQSIDVYQNLDLNGYQLVGTITGTGDYIDPGKSILIGSSMMGTNKLGGGGGDVVANHYRCQLHVRTEKFDESMLKFVATGVGYVSISEVNYFNILLKGTKIPRKYRT